MIQQTKARTWAVDHYFFDANGKRRRKLRTFATHKDAVAYSKEALAQVQKREFVAPSKTTVGERATEWFDKRFANDDNFDRSTRVERKNHIERYIRPAFGPMPIQNLTVEKVEKQMLSWNEKVSALMVNRVVRTLTDILAEAKRYGLIKDNPGKDAKRLPEESKAVTPDGVFTKDELRRLIAATVSGTRERAIIMTLALTGVRVGELLGASWCNVDLGGGKLHIRTTMADPDKGKPMIFKKPKTEHSIRTVPMSKELVHELKIWKLKCPPSERDLLISSDLGRPVRRRVAAVLVKKLTRKLGIEKDLHPHSLRHTFASLLLADHVPIPEVSALLGHKNPGITLKTYSHFTGEHTDAVHDFSASLFSIEPDRKAGS